MLPPLIQSLHDWQRLVMRRSMHNLMIFAKERGYSVAQLNTLFRLHHRGACGISDLGEEMGVSRAAASQLLDRLVQQGLATRQEDPQDRRSKRVTLTPAGERLVQESLAAHQGWLADLAAQLTPAEQEQVNAALRLLIGKARTDN